MALRDLNSLCPFYLDIQPEMPRLQVGSLPYAPHWHGKGTLWPAGLHTGDSCWDGEEEAEIDIGSKCYRAAGRVHP